MSEATVSSAQPINPSSPKPQCRRNSLGLAKIEYKTPSPLHPFFFFFPFSTQHWLAAVLRVVLATLSLWTPTPIDNLRQHQHRQPAGFINNHRRSTLWAPTTSTTPLDDNPLWTTTNDLDDNPLDDNPLWTTTPLRRQPTLWTPTTSTTPLDDNPLWTTTPFGRQQHQYHRISNIGNIGNISNINIRRGFFSPPSGV
jgi:hypothetical protein